MGIIPWLIMLRLRKQKQDEAEVNRNAMTPEKQDKLRSDMSEWMMKYSAQRRSNRQTNPMDAARGIFD